jgi:serpin B
MKMNKTLLAFAAMMFPVAIWAGDEPTEPQTITLTAEEQELVNSSNDFALRLFKNARTDGNMVLSPLSVTYALGMLNNGAAGITREEICQTLGFGDTGADGINAFCRKMLTEAPLLDEQTKVMISNAIFLNEPRYLLPEFMDIAHNYYDAETQTRDFHDGQTMEVINQWASDHTMGMIEDILNDNSFNPDAASYLLNAVYFKGAWTLKFDKNETQSEAFNEGKSVPMMHLFNDLPYRENDDYQALALPYGDQAYRMTILLPRKGKTIDDVADKLDAVAWKRLQWLTMEQVDVKLPRFENETDLNLVDIMKAMGMTTAFDPSLADIPNFCNTPQYISNMFQSAKIKLDEEGTEAAAVTVVETSDTAIPGEPIIYEFHANRPFIYFISEQSTGAIFFIGQYTGEGTTANIGLPQISGKAENTYYNLNGQQMNGQPAKGIYIVNGKKVVK